MTPGHAADHLAASAFLDVPHLHAVGERNRQQAIGGAKGKRLHAVADLYRDRGPAQVPVAPEIDGVRPRDG